MEAVAEGMEFVKVPKAKTMVSRRWTTSELFEGLAHVLTDGKGELPDDIAQLEDWCC